MSYDDSHLGNSTNRNVWESYEREKNRNIRENSKVTIQKQLLLSPMPHATYNWIFSYMYPT